MSSTATDGAALRAPGAARQGAERVGIIDIGSNSIRLVVFDGLGRAPLALFNEKVLCGLGRGLERSRRLHPEGVVQALENLRRFVHLARLMDVGRLDVLATAAVRDALDGPTFVATVERQCRVKVRVVSGGEEAILSASGVISGIPEADGAMGDLGGGSVELVALDRGAIGEATTLPLGPLRLADLAGDDDRRARDVVDAALDAVPWLGDGRGRDFHAVGGAWRALARIHMDQARYPLHVIHQYAVPRGEAEDFLRVISRQSRKSLEKLGGVSRRRLDAVPLAALVLGRIVRAMAPRRVVFSAYGLREGHLHATLDPAARRRDPLIDACRTLAARSRRFGADGDGLLAWTDGAFPGDPDASRRLRHAAALLSDTGWSDHPDYRAEQSFLRALRLPYGGIDHRERVLLAVALHARYGGEGDAAAIQPYLRLADPPDVGWARAVGLSLRLAYTISGGSPAAMARARLDLGDGLVALSLPQADEVMVGEAVTRRLDTLARALGRTGKVVYR